MPNWKYNFLTFHLFSYMEEMLCALLRHETDDMPYEYFDFNDESARAVMDRLYSED